MLSQAEKETVIQFDEANQQAKVYTASWDMARSLKRAGYQPVKKAKGAWWFEIPVHAVRIEGTHDSLSIG
ncbi:hypothetical protein [Mechercharimyces sp. CAU 1602]|uniref:hypothetical protein n=1 Tax=Mechercharimyces sp. CAU 1602 TaxID=2973933 RepID=UPI0021633076|nr:hypothetical protein [Mechercharimyces sp. CAU 1602]MCS1352006.1 hypothetical protein [Mechercharimyces sp. CAU 1602]